MNLFQGGTTRYAYREVNVVQCVAGTIWSEKERPPWVPIELDRAAGSRVPEQDPQPASPHSSISLLDYFEPEGMGVEPNRSAQIRDPNSCIFKPHGEP